MSSFVDLFDPSKSLQALNLAISSKKEEACAGEKVVAAVRPHHLYTPVPCLRSPSLLNAHMLADRAKEMIQSDVEAFSPKVDYNGLNTPIQFIDFINKIGKRASEAALFLDFHVDVAQDIAQKNGSACAGQTHYILDVIAQKHRIPGHLVMERSSPTASPYHALGAILCEDGVVVIDPSLHAKDNKVVMIRPGEKMTATNIYNGKMEFLWEEGHKTIKKTTFTPSGPVQSEIVLSSFSNADECVMKQFMLNRPWYAITGCDHQGSVVSVLRIDLCQEKFVFQRGVGNSAIKFSLPFSAFNLERQDFDLDKISQEDQQDLVRGDFFGFFKIPKGDLFSQISRLIQNKHIIHNLYTQTRAPKTPAPC
jgi:hypothetical protein